MITGRHATVGVEFAAEQATLSPLPTERFDPGLVEQLRVDRRSRVSIRQNHYSVPARYVGRRLMVRFTATAVTVFDGPKVVAVHERGAGRYELLNRMKWRTRLELANAIFDYLEIFHNRQRRHSALGYLVSAGQRWASGSPLLAGTDAPPILERA